MIPVAGAARTRALDQAVIGGLAVPGRVLMEVAGRGVAEAVHARWPGAAVAVLCGPGNNGGDGFVIARWLHLWGHPVRVWAPRPSTTEEAQQNRALAQALVPFDELEGALAGTVVAIDAMLGTGQQQAPHGWAEQGLRALTRAPVRVAVDVPTGLCADTGRRLHPDLPAFDLTVALGRHKPGLWCAPGLHLRGELHLVDIGLDLGARVDPTLAPPDAWLLDEADVQAWAPAERPDAAKWNRGHVAIRAGGGAAVLAAHGAFRAGAGLVTLLLPRARWAELHGLWPEVILAEPQSLDPLRHDALVLGPGLGLDASEEIAALWRAFPGPLLADADALTVLARLDLSPPPGHVRALTPHVAEAARLLATSVAEVDADRLRAVSALRTWGTPLLKGPGTLIGATPAPFIVPTGTVALATAGTGDVLAGLAGGYLARGLPAERALALAAWRHGLAGQRMPAGGTASDLVQALRT